MPCDLILALDVPTRETAAPLLRQLRGSVRWVKIGLQMFTAYGPDYVRAVADEGFNIFLDLKLHDIPHTVATTDTKSWNPSARRPVMARNRFSLAGAKIESALMPCCHCAAHRRDATHLPSTANFGF